MQNQDREIHSLFHVQSESSIGRASMTLRELFQRASQMSGIHKIILTEYQTFASSMEAYRLMQEFKIDVCVGVEVNIHWKQDRIPMEGTLLLLPKDYDGQKIIEKALSKSYELKLDGASWFDFAFLESWFGPGTSGHEHVIATSGGSDGILYRLLKKAPQARKDLGLIQGQKKKLQAINPSETKTSQEKAVQSKAEKNTLKQASKARGKSRKWYELLEEEKKLTSILKRESRFQSAATDICEKLSEIFGKENFFVELVCHDLDLEEEILPQLVRTAAGKNFLIADEARYASNIKSDRRRQWLMEEITAGHKEEQGRREDYSMKSLADTVYRLQKILPSEVIQNGLSGREKCVNACYTMSLPKETYYPLFPGEDGMARLLKLLETGKKNCFPDGKGWGTVYDQRLYEELQVITQMGFADYFCIVEDIVHFAKELEKRDVAYYVGPGRGSAVGSLVCYLLNITSINPVKADLLFSRFLNSSRKTAPDIDIDIAPQIYGRVLAYCRERYGEKAIGVISTKIRMGALQALEYAANAHKASPQLLRTMKECIKKDAESLTSSDDLKEFAQKNKKATQIYADALLLEGRQIGIGQHPSGLVLSDAKDISDRTPVLFNNRVGNWQTYLDMGEIEQAGLLKIDLLKLRTLDVISETLRGLKQPVHPESIPLSSEVFQKVFAQGNTVGVFQLESKGMRELLIRFQPQNLEDLTLLISIYRPGPLQYAEQIIRLKTRNGFKRRNSPILNDILRKSYGYPIYQEQLIEIFHRIGGLTLPEADEIRKAISKKKVESLEPYRQRLVDGLIQDGMTNSQALHLWNELIEFGHYAFNRSHAVAYAKLAYITGYLKYYFPKEFLCALLNHSEKERIPVLINECKRNHISVLPPDIHTSKAAFSICGENKILFGLAKIKGVSLAAVEKVLQTRSVNRLVSMKDFMERAHMDSSNTDLFILAGAMDCWTNNRRKLVQWYHRANRHLLSLKKELEFHGETPAAALYRRRFRTELFICARPHTIREVAEDEEKVLGCCLSVDLLAPYRNTEAANKTKRSIVDISQGETEVCGLIANIKILKRKKDGKEFASFCLKDGTGEVETVCFSDLYAKVKEKIEEGTVVKVSGEYDGTHQIIVGSITRLHADNSSVTVSIPQISKWLEFMPYLKTYSQPEGRQLFIQDRSSNQLYRAPFCVSDEINKVEWSRDCYLIGNRKVDVIEVPRQEEHFQEAA